MYDEKIGWGLAPSDFWRFNFSNIIVMEALQKILEKMELLGDTIRKEGLIFEAELEERRKLGLSGPEAIEHYNSWMERFNMSHLKV